MSKKLQAEIERSLKEVTKGCESFDEIHLKVQHADTQAKKDKSEEELKSQIKKLQRVRDQLKGWLATEEIREKDPLVKARKDIEARMELFKKVRCVVSISLMLCDVYTSRVTRLIYVV
jgi:CCR4-NOT transcription complex subunit 3